MKQLLKKLTLWVVTLTLVCGLTPAAFAANAGSYDVYLETEGGVCDELVVFAYKLGNGYYLINDLPTPTLEGYRFLGWYDDQIGGKKVTRTYNFSEDTTLYAHWILDPTAGSAQTETKAEAVPEPQEAVEITTKDKMIAWAVAGAAVGVSVLILVLTTK